MLSSVLTEMEPNTVLAPPIKGRRVLHLVVVGWLLLVGCWWLVVVGWLLLVGCWWFVLTFLACCCLLLLAVVTVVTVVTVVVSTRFNSGRW